ncbi:flotillin family protein [Gracilibacillus caseinilyticus]|uniref:Flotillin family protein n=1 Tax=Gracilibacillus caseinilyticus TaxID=2932256 RepID=A0ABY4F067_9BACI|nr:flotillin family protein [Gracilibacillus caseinilyticus]UOQ49304.1 flotillin family protein [Gracilibacillus caseinilyticus]
MDILIVVGVVVAIILAFAILFAARYKTVGADDAMIVTGSFLGSKNVHKTEDGGGIKIVRGGGAFILPIFQQKENISLRSHSLDISTPNVYTENGVPVMADGTAIIKVQSTTEGIATAGEQFLGKDNSELRKEAQEVLEGHLRAILGTMTVEEIYKNRERFAQEVQTQAAVDLKKMGLQIVSFTIKDVQDENGYLEALGKPRIAEVKRDAQIAEANAMRDARIQKAQAERESKGAELLSETQIAESTKEKELKVASYKRDQDTARAEADMAYKLQGAKSEQLVKQEEMQIQLVEKNKQIEIDEKEVLRKQRQYEAEISKKAEAERYATEQKAEADKVTRVKNAEAESEQIRLDGLAEADAIREKGLAEAEAKEKLAEAMDKYGEAAILEMIIKMLPDFAAKIAEPVRSIDKVTVVDSGNGEGDGATRMSQYVTKLMSQLPETLKDVSGVDLKGMLDNVASSSESKIKQQLSNQKDRPAYSESDE